MSKPAQKCETIFKQIYALKLFIAFAMAYSCCFSLHKGKSRFSRFPPKMFYNINYCLRLRSKQFNSSKRCNLNPHRVTDGQSRNIPNSESQTVRPDVGVKRSSNSTKNAET